MTNIIDDNGQFKDEKCAQLKSKDKYEQVKQSKNKNKKETPKQSYI